MTAPAPLSLPPADDAQEWVAARTRDGLAAARELVDRLRTDPPAATIDLLRQWDEVSRHLSNVAAAGSLLANVHPLEEVRTTCEQAEVEVDRYVTGLRQDRRLYEVFVAASPAGLDPVAARLLTKTLDDFRRAGVDLDDETRDEFRTKAGRLHFDPIGAGGHEDELIVTRRVRCDLAFHACVAFMQRNRRTRDDRSGRVGNVALQGRDGLCKRRSGEREQHRDKDGPSEPSTGWRDVSAGRHRAAPS